MTNDLNFQLTEFTPFPKIPRLNRDIVITEKIDGTNAAIVVCPTLNIGDPCIEGPLCAFAQSRKRVITLEKDNFGFARWVSENEQDLIDVLGRGIHFGEWWGHGIQRGYGLDYKKFSLFNTSRWAPTTQPPTEERSRLESAWALGKLLNVDAVPVLYSGPWMSNGSFEMREPPAYHPDLALLTLKIKGSLAAPGYRKPEGIVIFHTGGNLMFKATCENDEKWKGTTDGA